MWSIFKSATLISGLIICLCFLSCNRTHCELSNGISPSELLINTSKEGNYDYCELLRSALNGNNSSIGKLTLLEFSGAAGYDHGAVLIEVIQTIGEIRFKNAISGASKKEKELVMSYLDVGLMYGHRKEYEDKPLREVYPQLYYFLSSN